MNEIMRHVVHTEEHWHLLRSNCITASEAAVLIGQNPYSSPGKLKKDGGFTGNAYTLIGQVMEPVVVDVTNRVLGTSFKLYETVNNGKVFYVKGLLGATPDATDGTMLQECKSTKPDTYLKYKEAPPYQYLVQLQVQLWCTDIKEGYLAIMSTDLSQVSPNIIWPIVIYKVLRSDRLCEIIQQEAARFYEAPDKFRVNSPIKKEATELLSKCYERVYYNETVDKSNELKKLMREMLSK